MFADKNQCWWLNTCIRIMLPQKYKHYKRCTAPQKRVLKKVQNQAHFYQHFRQTSRTPASFINGEQKHNNHQLLKLMYVSHTTGRNVHRHSAAGNIVVQYFISFTLITQAQRSQYLEQVLSRRFTHNIVFLPKPRNMQAANATWAYNKCTKIKTSNNNWTKFIHFAHCN